MFTIGEFSKLSHISARMLRHYDKIGLLRPTHTGTENGYRYYDSAQLHTLLDIERLKGYGFTLAEIGNLLPLPRDELARRIHVQRLKLYSSLHEMRQEIRHMEEELMQMEGLDMIQGTYKVITMSIPAQRVFGIRRKISIAQTHELFQKLKQEMEKRGLKRAGAVQLLYRDEEFSYENMDVEAQVQVVGDHPDVQEIPGQFCAAVTHIGPYETLKYAYDALCAWMADHPEYKICGPAIERYLKDEGSVQSKEELETGILFPIQK